jgi:hypothetical protein
MQYENLLTNLVTADHQSYLLSCCSLPVLASLLDLEWKIYQPAQSTGRTEQNNTPHTTLHYQKSVQSKPAQWSNLSTTLLLGLNLIFSSIMKQNLIRRRPLFIKGTPLGPIITRRIRKHIPLRIKTRTRY